VVLGSSIRHVIIPDFSSFASFRSPEVLIARTIHFSSRRTSACFMKDSDQYVCVPLYFSVSVKSLPVTADIGDTNSALMALVGCTVDYVSTFVTGADKSHKRRGTVCTSSVCVVPERMNRLQ
jgi:hypothetical protein